MDGPGFIGPNLFRYASDDETDDGDYETDPDLFVYKPRDLTRNQRIRLARYKAMVPRGILVTDSIGPKVTYLKEIRLHDSVYNKVLSYRCYRLNNRARLIGFSDRERTTALLQISTNHHGTRKVQW